MLRGGSSSWVKRHQLNATISFTLNTFNVTMIRK
jgi:hypothetical protein